MCSWDCSYLDPGDGTCCAYDEKEDKQYGGFTLVHEDTMWNRCPPCVAQFGEHCSTNDDKPAIGQQGGENGLTKTLVSETSVATFRGTTVAHAVEVLNRAFNTDPEAMNLLFACKVDCNAELAKDPSIQVAKKSSGYSVGVIGLINGLFGVDDERWGAIAGKFDLLDEPHPVCGRYRLQGFIDNGREVKPK